MEAINWEPVLWVGGGLCSAVVLLLGIIAALIKGERSASKEERLEMKETIRLFTDEMKDQQKQIHELALVTSNSIKIIEKEQSYNNQKLELFEKYLDGSRFVKKRK